MLHRTKNNVSLFLEAGHAFLLMNVLMCDRLTAFFTQIFTTKDGTTKQINPDGSSFEMRADGTVIRNMSHKQVQIPREALIRQEPYKSADSKTPDATSTTPRYSIKY